MLDSSLLEQLTQIFSALESEIQIELAQSQHPSQGELVELLEQFVSTNKNLSIVNKGQSEVPYFGILKNNQATGVHFKGIPGGHEFSSLILAVLNADQKGKLPDQGILNRMAALKGPIDLRTYISLTCTNCPDVVQALNLIALNHPQITHTMVDGGLSPDEVNSLGIQGVPSVVDAKDQVLHVGKSTLVELIDSLEEAYGSVPIISADQSIEFFDVVVIGGGPAGVSSAIYSARKGLKTALVAQKLGGQVQETKGIENLISQTYTEGPQLAADMEKHLRSYEIKVLEHRQVEEIQNGEVKKIIIKGGETLETSSLIFATGAKWRELNIPGEKEYIGRGVAFCPHCDGPFYKSKAVAVIGGGNSGVEAAIDLANICSSVTLFEFAPELKADEVLVKKLKSLKNVKIIANAKTTQVLGNEKTVIGIEYQDRQSETLNKVDLDGIFVQIGLAPNSQLLKDIVEVSPQGEIKIDEKCRTNVKGIYAAGDVSTVPYKQIIIAMGEGAKAALSAFEDRMRG